MREMGAAPQCLRRACAGLCDNSTMAHTRKILVWALVGALAALVSYVGIRSYLSPELLLNFANTFYC